MGAINFLPDEDGVVRRVPMVVRVGDALAPALSLYEAHGFEYLPLQDTPYVRADVFMEKRLG